jgi:hypothetical protein
MKPCSSLVTLLILYIRDQNGLYIDYQDGFIWLADWLYPEDEANKRFAFPYDDAPDICSECLAIDGMTHGGRVREGCPACGGLLPYKDKLVHSIWKYRFCTILHINEAYFDFHFAYALEHIRNKHGERRIKEIL